MNYPGFVGASDRLTSVNVNAEDTINWFVELATGTPKARTWLVPTPGLRPFVVLGAGPVRGLFAQSGRAWGVGGGYLYEIFANHTMAFRGPVGLDSRPVSMWSNGSDGRQLYVVSAGEGYILNLDTNALQVIPATAFPRPCAMGGFVDGYFLALKAQSDQFQLSALEDGLSWDLIDTAAVSETTDRVVAMVTVHRDVWLLGETTTTVWADTGDPDHALTPIPGAFLQQGIAGEFAWTVADNALLWMGRSDAGARVCYRAQGYSPQRISTHAVEQAWARAPRVDDTIAWSYQDRGHAFACWYIPTADVTWVYDAATELWHKRALWDPTALVWTPHLARAHAFAFDQHLVGDRSSPAVYVLDAEAFSDGRVVVG